MPSPAQENPIYQPAMRIISAITNASSALVTTTFDHDYITGEIVRIVIPRIPYDEVGFGMSQINNQTGTITVISPTTFTIDINTTTYDAFINAGGTQWYAQVVPIGEVNSMLTAATQNTLPH